VVDAEKAKMDPWIKPPPRGEDLPHTDGEPMETARHWEQMVLLVSTLKHAWRDREDVYVAGNMFVYFSELQAKKNDFRGPDVFVVMDTVKRERKSWVVWEEDGRAPDVIIELTSPSTEHVDRGDKMRIYAKLLHVAEYYIFDPFSARLEGYELDASTRTYIERTPDERGRLASRVTGLSLGVSRGTSGDITADWLRWFAPDGRLLPTGGEVADSAMARADEATARADEALRRVAELEAMLAKR
jgi:Uma2 family endonuclease